MNSKSYPNGDNYFTNANKILCCYVNKTSHIQVVQIKNISNYHYKRVIFPRERLFFEALPNDFLEIYTGATIDAFLSDKLLCSRLRVN